MREPPVSWCRCKIAVLTGFGLGNDQRCFVFQCPRLFERCGRCGELRHDAQRVRPRRHRGGDAGDDAGGVVLCQAAFDLVYRLFRGIARDKIDATKLLVAHNLDFRALDEDVLAGGDGAVGGFREGISHETDCRAAAFLHAEHLDADFRQRFAHLLGEYHVEGELLDGGVEIRAPAYPRARDAGRELRHAGEDAVPVAHRLADDAVVLVDDGQQGVVLDFAALVDDAPRDVLVAQCLLRGRHLGNVVVIYVFCEEVGLQPHLPILFICHNLNSLKSYTQLSLPGQIAVLIMKVAATATIAYSSGNTARINVLPKTS